MAVFSKGSINTNAQTTIISVGASVKGEFNLTSMLYVEGSLEGNIASNNAVVVGRGGFIKGNVSAVKVVINGEFTGKISANEIEVLDGGILTGDIAAVTLSIEGGAKFNGKSTTIQSAEEIGDKLEKNGVELISENASKDL